MPVTCRRAVLSLLPKKGDLSLLKNWRPVALLTTEYKILSKCLANRLKKYVHTIVHKDQTYCIPNRSIMDNLFLVRDILDICKTFNLGVGLVALDQEKAFDRVDHSYLFNLLKVFGFGESFLNWIQLLYAGASCMVKVGGGLSKPISVQRGIRQGCPLSGLLYSIAIEPLLFNLRKILCGFSIPNVIQNTNVSITAYADDVTVLVSGGQDITALSEVLHLYEKASSAKVNWAKSEAFWAGQDPLHCLPSLPGKLNWGKAGLKILGVHFGSNDFQKLNWEGVMEKVCTRLSHWNWLLPKLSYRGRVLIVNNLVASTLWHRFNVLQPPAGLVQEVQRKLVNFFWSGQHWVRSSVLFLPIQEGGHSLVDIRSRLMTFRLQAAQRLLYNNDSAWFNTAVVLLRRAGGMGLDKHLFLMKLEENELTDLTPFYKSVLEAWKVFAFSRSPEVPAGMWLLEEPLFLNSFLPSRLLHSAFLRARLLSAGCTKLGHLLHTSLETLGRKAGVKSTRVLQKLVTEVIGELDFNYRSFLDNPAIIDEWRSGCKYCFPSLTVRAAVGDWQEQRKGLLSFRTPQMDGFESVGKKALYVTCVKVSNLQSLSGVLSTKWTEVFGIDSSPKGSWRILYKRPIDQRTGDLQWRIVHGCIATNRHVVHLDPSVSVSCPFCVETESVFHLFLQCTRLMDLFSLLTEWVTSLGETFSFQLFIFGPKYTVAQKNVLVLLNFLFGNAKLAIWKTRKNKILGQGAVNPIFMFLGLVGSRLRVEYAYYKLVGCLERFMDIWGINHVLCTVYEDELVLKF